MTAPEPCRACGGHGRIYAPGASGNVDGALPCEACRTTGEQPAPDPADSPTDRPVCKVHTAHSDDKCCVVCGYYVGPMTATPDQRLWNHRSGDRYVAASGHIVGNAAKFETIYTNHGTFDSLGDAISAGFGAIGCDDFNVGVVRAGRLIAQLWMNEIVTDDPDEMSEMAKWLDLEVSR